MENFIGESPLEKPEEPNSQDLCLTDRLMKRFQVNARIGIPLMVLYLVLGVTALLNLLIDIGLKFEQDTGPFYLFEGNNLFVWINYLGSILGLYFLIHAALEGLQGWKRLLKSKTDDDALLEGTERLGKMFKFFTWGICTIVLIILFRSIWPELS